MTRHSDATAKRQLHSRHILLSESNIPIMAEQVMNFVRLIESNPCIYNNTLKEYTRKDIVEDAWTIIAIEMGWSVADCKDKWKNIRNVFVRSLRPFLNGTHVKDRKPYYLYDELQFVVPFLKPVQQLQPNNENILLDEESHEIDDFCVEDPIALEETSANNESKAESPLPAIESCNNLQYIPKNSKRRKHIHENDQSTTGESKKKSQTITNEEDHHRMFLLSLIPDVGKLSDENLRTFKIETMILLRNMLTQQKNELSAQLPMDLIDSCTFSSQARRAPFISPKQEDVEILNETIN